MIRDFDQVYYRFILWPKHVGQPIDPKDRQHTDPEQWKLAMETAKDRGHLDGFARITPAGDAACHAWLGQPCRWCRKGVA
jgi:hypothetical protein